MTVSKTGADAAKPSRPGRKEPAEGSAEDAALQLGSGHCIDFHKASGEFEDGELAFAKACATSATA